MARFETRGQVASLFVGAGCVGLLMIVLLTAEARHREAVETGTAEAEQLWAEEPKEDVVRSEGSTALQGLRGLWTKLHNSLRCLGLVL